MSLIYLSHLLLTPTIHLTCDIASLGTCRNSYIVDNTCLWIWNNHWIITWLLAWVIFTINYGISCFICTCSYFNTSTFTYRNIYGLVSIAIPSSTILEDDVEFGAVFCIHIPVTLFGRCNFFTLATSRPYPCSDGLSPSSWNFSFYSDILLFFWLFWCSAWFIYRSPFRYYICGRVTTVSYLVARSIFFNISPTWT